MKTGTRHSSKSGSVVPLSWLLIGSSQSLSEKMLLLSAMAKSNNWENSQNKKRQSLVLTLCLSLCCRMGWTPCTWPRRRATWTLSPSCSTAARASRQLPRWGSMGWLTGPLKGMDSSFVENNSKSLHLFIPFYSSFNEFCVTWMYKNKFYNTNKAAVLTSTTTSTTKTNNNTSNMNTTTN